MSVEEAELLVKDLGYVYVLETLESCHKFTIMPSKIPHRIMMISFFTEKLPEIDSDCIFSYFHERELLLADYGIFNEVVKALKEFINNINY